MDTVTLQSSLLDWEWVSCPETLALWVHILFRASSEDRRWRGILIPKGSVMTTLAELAEASGLSFKQVRTHLKRLVSSGYIILKGTNKYTLITICDSDTCECKNEEEGNQRANKGQSEGNQNIPAIDCESESYKNETNEQGNQPTNNIGKNDEMLFSKLINNNKSSSQIENKKKERVAKATPKKDEQKTEMQRIEDEINALADEIASGTCACADPCSDPFASAPAKKDKAPAFDLSFVDKDLLPDFLDFIAMRREIKQPIKTQRGVNGRYKKLMRLSGGDTALAKEIIRQSIEYEWQDFYQLKSQDNGKNNIAAHLRSEEDFSDRHYDTTLPDWSPSGGGAGSAEELLP